MSLVIADIYTEDFEEMGLCCASCLPRIYKRYIGDIFTILSMINIYVLLNHLNFINDNI